MNIDDLSKSQLLLLTILVNFVMSVATGIVTVSLLDQAPPNVTQTVNRIVEQTVQTVAPASVAATIEKPTPAAQPSEQDQLESAIGDDAARTVKIYTADQSTEIGVGTYLPKAQAIVAGSGINLPLQAIAVFSDSSTAPVSLSRQDSELAIYGFADNAKLPAVAAPALLPIASLKQGQAIIALTGDGSAVTGIVSKIATTSISSTLPAIPDGAAAVSLTGGLVGVSSGGSLVSTDAIAALLSATSSAPTP